MLNFKRKRVLNPILMLKSIILSVFIGAFTVVTSLPVDASLASQLDEIFKNDPSNEEQINLEEELAISTGQDNHSEYLPVYRDVGTNTDVDQKMVTAALDVHNAYKDATAAAEEQKAFMDEGFRHCRDSDLYDDLYYKAVTSIINNRARWPICDMKQYDSEDEKTVFSAVFNTSVQNHMFNQMNEARNLFQSNGGDLSSTHICLRDLPVDNSIPCVDTESAKNGHSEQSSLNDFGDYPYHFGNNFSNQNTYTFDEEKPQDNSEESQINNYDDILDGWQYES